MPQDHEQVTATAITHVNSVDKSLSENDAHSLEGEAIDKQPRKGLTAAKDPTRKGKTSAGKTDWLAGNPQTSSAKSQRGGN